MQNDSELIDRLSGYAAQLPTPLLTFSECLGRHRDRCEDGVFRLTEAQREQALEILGALADGLEGKQLPGQIEASERVEALAQRVRELRERKKALDEELGLATDDLVREAGVGVSASTAAFGVRIGEPRLSVKVKDADQLPPAFLSMQPNRKAILEHVRTAAEVPLGAEISETRPTVYFSAPKKG
ncbi:MAG: hypothetical protein ACI8QS_002628 [Planctomycetota bacterium]|jgi:hypothetical protein